MISPTETYQAWTTAMRNIATCHADRRAAAFFQEMQEFDEIPPDKKPVVSPFGNVLAEMIALISILRAQTIVCKEHAIRANDRQAAEIFARAERQEELAARAIKNINLF
jgi:hypothetical protein